MEQKVFELQKVLEFKVETVKELDNIWVRRKVTITNAIIFPFQQKELDAVNAAHSNRLQRYKNLQQEYKIVVKQLKTFENSR